LASNISGNVGMLGSDYAGLFPWDDADAACALLRRCRQDLREGLPTPPALLGRLHAQCALRAPWFAPAAEASALQAVLADALRLYSTALP
jgi:hypothetical protein